MSIGGNILRQRRELGTASAEDDAALRRIDRARRQAERSAIKVGGPITPGQKTFTQELSRRTGLAPQAVGGWVLQEMSGDAARRRDAEGYYNYLNVGHFASGEGSQTKEDVWRKSPLSAARQTDRFLRGKAYGASDSIRSILPRAQGKGTAETVDAIADSNWATDPHYRPRIHSTSQMISADGAPPTNAAQAPQLKDLNASRWLQANAAEDDLTFPRPLARRLRQLAKASGAPLQVNSGYRTYDQQAALYQAHLNGTGNLAARPGTSNHEFGAAADISLTPEQRALLPKFGLGLPVPGEDWHVELQDGSKIVTGGAGHAGHAGHAGYAGTAAEAPAEPPVLPAFMQPVSRVDEVVEEAEDPGWTPEDPLAILEEEEENELSAIDEMLQELEQYG